MNTRNLPVSVMLVALGAGAVLIIGAFARFDPASTPHPAANPSQSPAALTEDDPPAAGTPAPALPAHLSPGLAEIIKLAQAHVGEDVILAYIKTSGHVFAPTADEILYLSDLGLSQEVIGEIVKNSPPAQTPQNPQTIAATAAPVPTATAMPPPMAAAAIQPDAANQPDAAPTANAFYNDLAPYGAWVQQQDYGLCWQPTVETIDPNWTPYLDGGQWLYTDSGWYWQSDYTWGWAVFHYGRWIALPHRGWAWVPGNQWGPGWVAWRSAGSYIGWAALPPGVGLNVLAQFTFNSQTAGANATLGLSASAFNFVSLGNLASRNLHRHLVPAARVKELLPSSVLLDSYMVVDHRIFNAGASREAVAAAANKPVPEIALRSVSSPGGAGLARDGKTLAVYVAPVPRTDASPSAPIVKDQVRTQTQKPTLSPEEPVMLAENKPIEDAVAPAEGTSAEASVQLPSLRYPAPASPAGPPVIHHHPRSGVIIASGADAAPGNRDWQTGYGRPAPERPATPAPAPRYDGFAAHAQVSQAESARATLENRPAPAEIRAAPPVPVRAAPAYVPASSPPSSVSSKSGK